MAMHSHSRSSPLSVCVSRGKVTVEEMVLDDEQETGGQTSTRVRERMIEKGEMKLKKKNIFLLIQQLAGLVFLPLLHITT